MQSKDEIFKIVSFQEKQDFTRQIINGVVVSIKSGPSNSFVTFVGSLGNTINLISPASTELYYKINAGKQYKITFEEVEDVE